MKVKEFVRLTENMNPNTDLSEVVSRLGVPVVVVNETTTQNPELKRVIERDRTREKERKERNAK